MKIFHCVESYHPALGGMQEVVKQLSERLVKAGHNVTVLTRFHPDRKTDEYNGVKIVSFQIEGNPKKAQTKEEERYVDTLLSADADVIGFFAAQQWATDLALPVLQKIKAVKVSVPTGYSGLYWPDFKQYFEDMKTHIHGYDMNVYLSEDYRDINFARENGVSKMVIIPNGAGEDEFLVDQKINVRRQLAIPDQHFLILHVGSYSGWKGHEDAIRIFLKSGITNATLLMIGNNYENFSFKWIREPALAMRYLTGRWRNRKRIIFNYFNRAFTVAAYQQADLFLFPSNIECSPIVLFECAAAALPFLSSDSGNAPEIARWTGGGEILPTTKDANGFSFVKVDESAKILRHFYENKEKRKALGEKAFVQWKKRFSWEVITKSYEDLYLRLIKEKK
jgi:L-malate glycosyltransferase